MMHKPSLNKSVLGSLSIECIIFRIYSHRTVTGQSLAIIAGSGNLLLT